MTQAQYFHYDIIEIYPLKEKLEELKKHRRLRVFYEKGVICANPNCDKHNGERVIGKIVALGKDKFGNLHYDIYTEDFYPLTVDHILPKSFGGSDHIDNLQPMCCLCNWLKGDGIRPSYIRQKYRSKNEKKDDEVYEQVTINVPIGTEIYKSVKKNRYKSLGTLKRIASNPYFNDALSVQVYEKDDNSYYNIGRCYIKLI